MAKVMETVRFETISCKCGGVYALTVKYLSSQRDVRGSWACPFCLTGWGFSGISETRALKKELVRERAQHDQTRADRDTSERRRCAEKGAKTKLKKRIANGVCPCCNRSFKDLHRHMTTKHSDFLKKE